MKALSVALRGVGYAWIAVVVAFGVWRGILTTFLHAPEGLFDNIYVLLAVAAPGLGVVALASRLDRKQ